MKSKWLLRATLCAILSAALPARAADQTESLEQLRNTVINLLDGLVQKGVLTREQAQAMVTDAQTKAEQQAKAKAAHEDMEKDAVRVTYVPEIVKQQIRDQVREELRPEVTKEVVAQAKLEKWGVPGALPEWITKLSIAGDVRLRGQSDNFAADNAPNQYYDVLAVNSRGGIGRAGTAAFLNTTEDRLRERLRARIAINANISSGVSATVRLASGNLVDPVSTNQTLGQSGARYTVGIDQAYLRFDTNSNAEIPWMTVWGGRIPNPYYSTDLVWDPDLQFEGIAATWRLDFGGSAAASKNIYLTAGAFPLQEIELSTKDKWLYGGQLGVDWSSLSGLRARLAASYYYFQNISGVRNLPDSSLLDYTAPQWVQKGNTLFDIRNDIPTDTNLLALAAEYHLANMTLGLEAPAFGHKILFTADYVRNVGFDRDQILARTGINALQRNEGYQFELGVGTTEARNRGDWRAYLEYRYLQADAVLDAFTDSDFHLGGTDAKGYVLRGEWWFKDRVSLGLRYLSSSEIDGPPLGIDTLMLDINGAF